MKLTFLIILIGLLEVSASVYSQQSKLSMSLKNVTLVDAFRKIEDSSNFVFFYNAEQIQLDQKVSLNAENRSIDEILNELFHDKPIAYKVFDRRIVLYPKENENPFIALQSLHVKGRVTNINGEPVPGATVVVKETTNGVITDFEGNFSIMNVPEDAILVFSFVGLKTQEIPVSGKTIIDVRMEEETIGIEEVVAIGYGVQRKSDLTGATTRLTEDNMNKSVATSPIEMMQGRISGVNITQNSGEPGAGMSVRIRGSNSIRSGQDPLYVIDGIPLDNADITPNGGTASGINESANKNPISFLNPDDIESIDVLKDASSTAIYGARGANGVVIITTKKGKQGEGTITYDGYTGLSRIREKMDVLTAEEFRSYRKNDGSALSDLGASIDWQDKVFRTALTHNHNISYGGGTDKHTYRASVGYLDQEGIVKTTGVEKINGKILVTQKAFNNRLNITGNLIASHVEDTRAPIGETGGYEGDVILTSLKLNPTFPIYNDDGSYYQHSTTQRNPVAMLNLTSDITETDHIISNVSIEFEIIKNLKYKLNLGIDRTVAERQVNQDNDLSYLSNQGEADVNSIRASNKLIENYITYLKDFGEDHHFNFLLGHAYQKFKVSGSEINVTGFEVEDILYTDNLEYGNFSAATVNSYATENELQSFFGRVNYNFKDRYLLTFTGRIDGSSKFGENNKYGFFPSGAFAWRVSEEDFMKSQDTFTNLKLRLGWGKTGNQEIPDKISLLSVGTTSSANGYFNGSLSSGITFLRTPNPDIQWETTTQLDLGIDFGLLSDRLSGTLDLFYKKTKDVLLELTSKAPAATETQWLNVPGLKILNKGIELGVNGILVKNNNLYWEAGLNISYIDNNVKDLPVTLIETGNASGQGLSDTRVQIITNDQPIGTFYGRVFQGFDSDGLSIYQTDLDGDEIFDYLGSALPDYTYNFTSKLKYKEFDFSMLWYGSRGNKVYNNTANALFVKASLNSGSNVTKKVLDSEESASNSNAFSSRFVEDGSFLRLANVTLGYTFNTKAISWLSKARVYVTGNNLLLFTDYSGFDPEVNIDANENDVPSIGIDYTAYPKARTFTFGVNLQF